MHLFHAKYTTNNIFFIYVLLKNALQLYFWCTKLVYLKSAKLEQLMLYLMHFNCAEAVV